MARALDVGERGEVIVTGQKRDPAGRWRSITRGQKAERYRARCYHRGHDGVTRERSCVGKTRPLAVQALERALELEGSGQVEMTADMSFIAAGRLWLAHISMPGLKLAPRTISDYSRTFDRYIDADGSAVRGLSLAEANNPQRLRRFLQTVADSRGTGSAHQSRSVITGILQLAVDNGVQVTNAVRQINAVRAQNPRLTRRKSGLPADTTRAFTMAERNAIVAHAADLAARDFVRDRSQRKSQAVADLVAFLAGTGVRIGEARTLRWENVNLAARRAEIAGTKSRSSHRTVTLPVWLSERLAARAEFTGAQGYVFGSPHNYDPELIGQVPWDQANCAHAVRALLDDAGFAWAVPHSFRRSVASIAHAAGAPLVDIADQLGHADPAMTARVYLGRDPFGDRASVADHL